MQKSDKKCRKRILYLLVISAAAGMLYGCSEESTEKDFVWELSSKDPEEEKALAETVEEDYGISMEDVIELALAEGKKYYDDLHLTEVHSYDNDSFRRQEAGSDGSREWWYVNLANEQMNYVSILFNGDNIMTTMNYDSSGNYGLFDMDEVKLTCAEAVQKAKELGIRGGNPEVEEEWVSGYNFQLMYGSLVEAPDDRILMLGVICISENGNFARVYFVAATG